MLEVNIQQTLLQYEEQLKKCRDLFAKKLHDYEPAWRILRLSSLTDQLYIKILRIRNIEQIGKSLIEDSIEEEYIGIVNYGIIGLIQSNMPVTEKIDISNQQALELYDRYAEATKDLMIKKNHDYGEAWRSMRLSSFTDLILSKILRIKQIEDLEGKTVVSEGIPANYQDIINYALFSLIRLSETI